MPIHRERYRRRDAGTDVRGRAWLVICVQGLRGLAKRRAFLYLMLVAWLPCLVRGVQIYVVANFPQARIVPDALVRLVQAYHRISYADEARETCDHLRQFYPAAPGLDETCPAASGGR